MIFKFLAKGGGVAIIFIAFLTNVTAGGPRWIPAAIGVLLAIGATHLVNKTFSWPRQSLVRAIFKAAPADQLSILVNKESGHRFILMRPKFRYSGDLAICRFSDDDVAEHRMEAGPGKPFTVMTDTFIITGRAMVARKPFPLTATFEPFGCREKLVLGTMPKVQYGSWHERLRAQLDEAAFNIRTGVQKVTHEEFAELAEQLRGATPQNYPPREED